MKILSKIIIAIISLTITQIYAQNKAVIIERTASNTIEIRGNIELGKTTYFLEDSIARDWSSYIYVYGDSGKSALVSEYASEVFILVGDSALKEGFPGYHYALQGSSLFIYGNTLYGYGGYGFWTTKNILRYWSSDNGWVPILTSNNSPALLPAHHAQLVIIDSVAIIIGGKTTDERNPFMRKASKFIQTVDLKTKIVEIVDLNYELNRDNFLIKQDLWSLFQINGELILIDLKQLSLISIFIDEEIHYLIKELQNGKINIIDLLKVLNKNKKYIGPANPIRWIPFKYLILILFLLLFAIFFFIKKKNSNQFIINANFIQYGSNKYLLSEDEKKIIEYLNLNGPVQTARINTLFSQELSESHRNKLRNQTIKNLNNQVKTISQNNIANLIQTRPFKNDSRMSEYFLSRNS